MMQQNDPLKIFSLNIETDRHFDRIVPYIKKVQPDIVLLQEVYAKNVSFLEQTFNMKGFFTALCSFQDEDDSSLGLLNLTALNNVKNRRIYYRGNGENPPIVRRGRGEGANIDRAVSITEFFKNNQQHCVINTHFTWTPDGLPSEKQYEDLEKMLKSLTEIPKFILCGDFNAPRGGPVFEKIAAEYQDNIPKNITTTIDKNLHKAGDLQLVVDGLFSTPQYKLDSIEVVSGLSDHCGILATLISSSI